MAEGRNTSGGVGGAGLRWWQVGSTEKKPTYFSSNAYQKALKADRPFEKIRTKYYAKQDKLISARNQFYSSYNANTSEPKYSFAEAMRLSSRGYTGVYGRTQAKQTLGLMGEEWQRAYALDRLRKNKDMLAFSIMNNTSPAVLKDIAAATQLVTGGKKYNQLADLYTTFGDKYGTNGAKYVDRYGHKPTVGSKYGILFNTDNKKIRKDDVNVTYQNNTAQGLFKYGQALFKDGEKNNNDSLKAVGLQYMAYKDYLVKSSRGEYNPEKVKEMETAFADAISMSGAVARAVGGEEQSRFTSVGTGLVAATAAALSGNMAGIASAYNIGSSAGGNKLTTNAIDYMNGLAESDVLRARKTYWSNQNVPLSQKGLIGFTGNALRGFARMGLGLPAGLAMAGDEAYLAGKETYKWATNDKYGWGDDVDFQMGDAIWKDLSTRYYDPFAKDGSGKDRSWLDGLSDPTSYDRFGEQINADPAAYALDILDAAPVLGFTAKAGAVFGTTGRSARIFGGAGRMGVDASDRAAFNAARNASREILTPEVAQDRLANVEGLQRVFGTVDESTIAAAEAAVDAAKFDAAPSARTWRKTARAAYNGDELAQAELSRWKAMGLEFNGLDTGWGVRATALFEPRTKVLEKPESVLEANPNAVYRLPASPIVRGLKEAFFWVGRGVDKATIGASATPGFTGRVASKLVDMPLLSYRYNYTKAVKNAAVYEWGDVATELQRAARLLQIDKEAELTAPMRRAIEARLMGGSGPTPLQAPAIQRQQIRDRIDRLPRDKNTGEVVPTARKDLANLELKLTELLDDTIANIDEAAAAFDELFDENLTDLDMRLADSTYKAGDVNLDKAVDLYNRLERQDQATRSRIAHDDTTPRTLKQLELLYKEAMEGLGLNPYRLFGKNGRKGRLGRFTTRVLRVNTNLLITGLAARGNREALISLAQKADEAGTVFDDIADPVIRKQREDQMVEAVEALQRIGVFTDGLGSYGVPGRPVLIKAAENVGNDFVAFHIPTLRHEIDAGKVIEGKLVDTNEVFVLPKVFFSAKRKGAGAPILEDIDVGRKLLYEGALNGMSSVYSKARFYSEKVNDTGRTGVRQNEQIIGNESRVALSGMRQHALSRIIQSRVNFMKSRIERDLRTLAETAAVLIPASRVTGKTASESGYHTLHNVGVFDNVEDALDFARLRGVGPEAEDALASYLNGTLDPVESTLDINSGMGVRMINGEPQFIVRGGLHDWLSEALQEDLATHSTTKAWIAREFSDPNEIPSEGFVLAIPNQAYRDLAEMTIEADSLSARLLSAKGVKGWGNLFKFFVLNANPGFISNNIIGGLAMMMMFNPSVAPLILSTVIEKMARESMRRGINNDWFTAQLTNFKAESEAVARSMAYETEHNIYKQDAGIQGVAANPQSLADINNPNVTKAAWAKKYVWHGGYTVVSAWESMMRRNVGMQFLRNDAGFQSFMRGPEVQAYIDNGVDWNGNTRTGDDTITPFEAATDLLLDRSSPYFNANLKHRMRYITNTVSGNYHNFSPAEQLMRNVVMPFYAWQRHSATFSYRMLVDRPITSNVLYHIGQQGYQQNLEQGVPEWMMQTIPVPQVIKDMFGISDTDFRIDGNALSPFGTSGDMGMAAFKLLTGGESHTNVFEFGNPYFNALIKDTFGVDPRTGNIDWTRLQKDGTQAGGVFGMVKDMGGSIMKATYPYKIAELAKYNEYEADALQNKYAAIDNAPDILKNYDPSDPKDPWRLKIPNMKAAEAADPTQRLFSALGIKSYRLNPSTLPPSVRQDAVGAIVLKYINDAARSDQAMKGLEAAQKWKRRYEYVTEVWVPAARAQGMDESQIMFVLNKIQDERPKTGIAKQLSMMGG
jgi:hypothetical protein